MLGGGEKLGPPAEIGDQPAQRVARLGLHLLGLDDLAGRRDQRYAALASIVVKKADRRIAQAALRRVDDALEGEIVRRLADAAEISERIANLHAFIKARAANDAVIQPHRDEAILEGAHLEGGAHQDRHVVEIMALALEILDLFADRPRLFLRIPAGIDLDLRVFRIGRIGEERLAEPVLVMGDQMGRSAQNMAGRAVVAFEPDHGRARKVLLEAQDIVDLGAAPAIDRLVVVADAADIDGRSAFLSVLAEMAIAGMALVLDDTRRSLPFRRRGDRLGGCRLVPHAVMGIRVVICFGKRPVEGIAVERHLTVVGKGPDVIRALAAVSRRRGGGGHGRARFRTARRLARTCAPLRQKPQPDILRRVGVLILVHQNIAEAPVIIGENVRMAAKDRDRMHQEIAEIAGIEGLKPRLIGGIEFAALAIGKGAGVALGNVLRRQALVLPPIEHVGEGARRPALVVQILRLDQLLDQPDLIVGIENREIRLQAGQLGMATQDLDTDRVEGA